jgi:hypothetical protein
MSCMIQLNGGRAAVRASYWIISIDNDVLEA